MNVNKIIKVVKLTRLYGLVMMTINKNNKSCYSLKTDKDSVKNENNRKKKICEYDAKRKTKIFSVRFCARSNK